MTSVSPDRVLVLASSVALLLVVARLALVHPITVPLLCRATTGRHCAPEQTAGVRPLHLPLRVSSKAMAVMSLWALAEFALQTWTAKVGGQRLYVTPVFVTDLALPLLAHHVSPRLRRSCQSGEANRLIPCAGASI